MKHRILHAIAHLEHFVHRPWYMPLIAFLAGSDMFVGIIPTDGLLISSAMLKPKKWISFAFWVTLGSALGAWALTLIIHQYGIDALQWAMGDVTQNPLWQKFQHLIDDYGAWGLALIALGPTPLVPGVILAGLAKMPAGTVLVSCLFGRFPKYLFFSWAATHAPHLLRKIWGTKNIQKEVEEIQKSD